MNGKPQLYRVGRASAIEKIFHEADELNIESMFAAVQLLDRYFGQENLEIRDLAEAHLIATISTITVVEGVAPAVTVRLLESVQNTFKWDVIAGKEDDLRSCLDEGPLINYSLEFASIITHLLRNCLEEIASGLMTDERSQQAALEFL